MRLVQSVVGLRRRVGQPREVRRPSLRAGDELDDVLADLVELDQRGMCTDPAADRGRSGESDLVQAVVDGHARRFVPAQPAQQERDQRQRQLAVRDRAAERTRCRPFGVDVDPLVVLGVLGETVDAACATVSKSVGPSSAPRLALRSSTVR